MKLPAIVVMAGFLAACAGSSPISSSSPRSIHTNSGSNAAEMSVPVKSGSGPSEITRVNPPAQKPNQLPVAPVLAPTVAPRVQVQPGGSGDPCSAGMGSGKAQPMCLVE